MFEIGLMSSEVMNGDNSVVSGGVLSCMMEELEGTELFSMKNACPIYDMDSKTYHDSYIPMFNESECGCFLKVMIVDGNVYEEIEKLGDEGFRLMKEKHDERDERYKEYRSLCEDMEKLFEYKIVFMCLCSKHPELNKQMRDEFNVLSRVVELKNFYSHDTYLEQQLESLKEYKKQLEKLADLGGRGVLPFAFDFKTQ